MAPNLIQNTVFTIEPPNVFGIFFFERSSLILINKISLTEFPFGTGGVRPYPGWVRDNEILLS